MEMGLLGFYLICVIGDYFSDPIITLKGNETSITLGRLHAVSYLCRAQV